MANPAANMGEFGDRMVERQSRMFASFDYLREILDSCSYVAIVLNEERRIVFFNRALYALTGPVEDGRLIGQLWGDALRCKCAIENDGCGVSQTCQTCGAFGAIGEGLNGVYGSRDCRFTQLVDGRAEWLDLSITVSPAFVQDECFLVCTVRDISHEKRKAVLERIFFHDLLNGVTGVVLLAGMLQSLVEGEASAFAGQIRACADDMVEEIESQQQLIAAERDELAVKPVEVGAGDLVRSLAERYRLHPLAKDRTIAVSGQCQDIIIFTDDSLLRRVVENMLKNAVEGSDAGETITLGCRESDGSVEFWVHNPGTMAHKVQLQVFQRSFSTKGSGRGLGSYSMRLLSERYLQGTVTFRSTAAEGTTFVARYPKTLDRKGRVTADRGSAEMPPPIPATVLTRRPKTRTPL